MKAATIESHGKLDQIKVQQVDPPSVGPNDVLVETKYAALNHLDIFVIRGWPGLKLTMPHVIGADGAGVVKEVGSEVSTVVEGDEVAINPGLSCGKCNHCLSGEQVFCEDFSILGENQWGTLAELIKIPEINAIRTPKGFELKYAAAGSLTFLTAYRMLTTQGGIKPGDVVFIHGAGGGVASAAIQIAKFFRAKVITSTSTTEKELKAKELGADHVINYKENQDFTKDVFLNYTDKRGVDIVIDSVGKATFPKSIKMVKPGGKIITCGVTSGPFTKIDLTNVFWKHLEIKGSTMANQSEFREVLNLIFEGKMSPVIDKEFSLDHVKEAMTYLNEGKQFGKIVVKI